MMSKFQQEVIDSARTFLNVPFLHQGRDHFGIDCVGLVVCSLTAAGYKPENAETFIKNDYRKRVPSSQDLLACIGNEAYGVAVLGDGSSLRTICDLAIPADLIVMSYSPGEEPSHVALVTMVRPNSSERAGNLNIIHTNNEFGCVKEHSLFPVYSKYVTKLYRLKCLCD